MARLDIEREEELSPKRWQYAIKCFKELNLNITEDTQNKCIIIFYKNNPVRFYPYSGWAAGKGIKDCRGIRRLLKQITL